MGNSCASSQSIQLRNNQIIVATLNYGGILNSPFQFYSNQQQQEKQISQIFKSLIPKYFAEDYDEKTFAWKIGKIDQKIQKQRYTPIYNLNAGIQNGKIISAQRFKEKWNSNFNQALPKAKLQKPPTQAEINCMRTFDLVCYQALLKHVYNKPIDLLQNVDAKPYQKLLTRFFSRSYLDQGKKIQKLMVLLNNSQNLLIDVLFIQQPTQKLINQLQANKNYFIARGQKDNSLIVILNHPKKKVFKEMKTFADVKQLFKITKEQAAKIQANKETRIVFCDKYIFVCAHLSSKAQKNKVQLAQLKQAITILKAKCHDYEFIIGGDMNTFVREEQVFDQKIAERSSKYPQTKQSITTCKKRTYMQPQFNKADKVNAECKDQFISTLKFIRTQTLTINKKNATGQLNLPTQQHPFDHFLVVCSIPRLWS